LLMTESKPRIDETVHGQGARTHTRSSTIM
jgi:hypothetical protein